jgi:hypothetical protein
MTSVFLVFYVEYPFNEGCDNIIGDEFSKVFHTKEDAEEYIKKTDVSELLRLTAWAEEKCERLGWGKNKVQDLVESNIKEWEIKEIPFG